MYKEVKNFEELKSLVLEDKESIGLGVDMRNRYPIRFVLFDNFRDCSLFVDFVQEEISATWKSPVCVTPEAQVPLTLESKFRMTPIKS